jgi:hypothetical protein
MNSNQQNHEGWIGIYRQLLYFLNVVGADKDAKGRPIVRGGISLFLGIENENNDVVVSGDAEYFVDGRACNLAAGLRSTSYGVGVKVF